MGPLWHARAARGRCILFKNHERIAYESLRIYSLGNVVKSPPVCPAGNGIKIEEYLAIPYVLVRESFEGADGNWLRRASYPELPGCEVEGLGAVDIVAELDELRVKCILELLARKEEIPMPRPPIAFAMPVLNRQQLEFARWLVQRGHLTDEL
jgi:hypothetical protein